MMRSTVPTREAVAGASRLPTVEGKGADRGVAVYALRYRLFEAPLPTSLADVAGRLRADDDGSAVILVERNLADELGRPELNLDRFDRFADAVTSQGTLTSRLGPPRCCGDLPRHRRR